MNLPVCPKSKRLVIQLCSLPWNTVSMPGTLRFLAAGFSCYSDSSRAQMTPRSALTQGILSVNLGHHPQSRKRKFICLLPSTRNPMFYSDFVLLSSNHVTPRVSRKQSHNRHTEQDAVEGHRPKRRGVSSEVLYESNTSMQESGRFLRTRKTAAMFDNASSTLGPQVPVASQT
jgi:hypothetical protein